ncbi:BTD.2 family protein [Megaselia abdita]
MFFDVNLCFLLLVTLASGSLSHASTTKDDANSYYVAGVVEFEPIVRHQTNVLQDLKPIEDIIFQQASPEVDIIVFPEAVIMHKNFMTYIPDPVDLIIPCQNLNYHHYLSELSCYARSAKKYLVFNLIEKVECNVNDTCITNSFHRYSTNVVFDRNGTVISKYRKTNLYYDEITLVERPIIPELATFKTDFGVTFAHFICFDLMFYTPSQQHVINGITDFVYPTSWFQELPFLTALQLHQGWSEVNDVNFLSAGANFPEDQNSGSGIFAGKWGALEYIISGTRTRKLITAKVPKKNQKFQPTNKVSRAFNALDIPPRVTEIVTKRDYNIDLFKTELLLPYQLSLDTEICHNGLCCEFSIKREQRFSAQTYLSYEYRVGAFNGAGTLQRMETTELGICAIFACTNKELSSCGRIFPQNSGIVANDLYFKSIEIKTQYKVKNRLLVMPSTVNGRFEPLPVDAYKVTKSQKMLNGTSCITYEMTLTKPQVDLLTFGLYGNYFVDTVWQHNSRLEFGDIGIW